MSVIRPKHITPLYKGARAVFFAGTTRQNQLDGPPPGGAATSSPDESRHEQRAPPLGPQPGGRHVSLIPEPSCSQGFGPGFSPGAGRYGAVPAGPPPPGPAFHTKPVPRPAHVAAALKPGLGVAKPGAGLAGGENAPPGGLPAPATVQAQHLYKQAPPLLPTPVVPALRHLSRLGLPPQEHVASSYGVPALPGLHVNLSHPSSRSAGSDRAPMLGPLPSGYIYAPPGVINQPVHATQHVPLGIAHLANPGSRSGQSGPMVAQAYAGPHAGGDHHARWQLPDACTQDRREAFAAQAHVPVPAVQGQKEGGSPANRGEGPLLDAQRVPPGIDTPAGAPHVKILPRINTLRYHAAATILDEGSDDVAVQESPRHLAAVGLSASKGLPEGRLSVPGSEAAKSPPRGGARLHPGSRSMQAQAMGQQETHRRAHAANQLLTGDTPPGSPPGLASQQLTPLVSGGIVYGPPAGSGREPRTPTKSKAGRGSKERLGGLHAGKPAQGGAGGRRRAPAGGSPSQQQQQQKYHPGLHQQQQQRAAARRESVRDMCLALQALDLAAAVPGGGERRPVSVAALGATLAPWSGGPGGNGALNNHTLTDVLKAAASSSATSAGGGGGGRALDPATALALFQWSQRQPWYKPRDVFVYTTLIGILGRAGEDRQVDALVAEMERERCRPNLVTYNRLLHAYGRANRVQEVARLCARIAADGLAPDFVTYSTIIDIYCKAGHLSKAMEIYRSLLAAGYRADAVMYSMLISAHGRAGDPARAHALFREMLGAGCAPNAVTYNALIDLTGKAGDPRGAVRLFEEMRSRGVAPDRVTYSSVIDAYSKAGMCAEAEALFEEMLAAGGGGGGGGGEGGGRCGGIAPDGIAWSTMVQMWGRAGNPRRAAEYFRRMTAAGWEPTPPAYNTLMYAFLHVGMLAEAGVVFDAFMARHVAPLNLYTLLLSTCTECTHQVGVNFLLDLMRRSGHRMHSLLQLLLQPERPATAVAAKATGAAVAAAGAAGMAGQRVAAGGGGVAALVEADRGFWAGAAAAPVEADREFWAEVGEHLESIRGEDLQSRRALADAVINFLYKCGWKGRAVTLWAVIRRKNVYPAAVSVATSESPTFSLDLHHMSSGTAVIAVVAELQGLRDHARALAAAAGKRSGGNTCPPPFPESVEIITGWGRRSKVQGSSMVKARIEDLLASNGSPFVEDESNVGRVKANGELLRQWLLRPETAEALSLSNEVA